MCITYLYVDFILTAPPSFSDPPELYDARSVSRVIAMVVISGVLAHRIFLLLVHNGPALVRCLCRPCRRKAEQESETAADARTARSQCRAVALVVRKYLFEFVEIGVVLAGTYVNFVVMGSKQTELMNLMIKYAKQMGDWDHARSVSAEALAHAPEGFPPLSQGSEIITSAAFELSPLIYQLVQIENQVKWLLIINVLFIMVDLHEHFAANPRFKSVPRTLVGSALPVAYLLVSCIALLLCYAGTIVVMWGGDDMSYASVLSSLQVMVMTFLGDTSSSEKFYSLQSAGGRIMYLLIFLTYIMVGSVVAFNIFLSIVIDTYSEILADISMEEEAAAAGTGTGVGADTDRE
jgi:hypothetical protein